MLFGVRQPLPVDEAIQALRRDPTHPVLVKVDEGLTVEVRAVEPANEGAPLRGGVRLARSREVSSAVSSRSHDTRIAPHLAPLVPRLRGICP